MKRFFIISCLLALLLPHTVFADGTAEKKVFAIDNPDKQLSPYTGMTREHWKQAALYLLNGAFAYVKDIDSPMDLPKQEGKSYPHNERDIPTSRMEALCRTMFLAGPLLKENPDLTLRGIKVGDYYRHQLTLFLDTASAIYLPPKNWRGNGGQKLVELGGLSVSLLMAPEIFWTPLTQSVRDSLAHRMLTYGEGETIDMNWRFFNMCILSFLKSQGYNVNETYLEDLLHKNLNAYVGNGWYHDAPLFDYYSMWAFQMYGPLWAESFGKKYYPKEAEQFLHNLSEITTQYPYMFGRDGKMQMWGRSITYRMGAAIPLALTGLLHSDKIDYGWMRRICSGALLQFLGNPDFIAEDGLPNLGFYRHFEPCLQGYSCRGSNYWMAKIFLSLYLPADNPFWTAKETEGAWETMPANTPNNIYSPKSKTLTTNHPSTGLTEFRNVFTRNSGFYYGLESYNRLAYCSGLPWQADGKDGEVAMCYVVKNNKGEWKQIDSYDGFGLCSDGMFRRNAYLAKDNSIKMRLAEKVIANGVVRSDTITSTGMRSVRFGFYALPDIGKGITEREITLKENRKAFVIDNGEFQVITIMLEGWDKAEFVHCTDLHPQSMVSTVVDLTADIEGTRILRSIMLVMRSGEKVNIKKIASKQ